MRIASTKDFLAGVLFAGFGTAFAAVAATSYAQGTPARMGAGFFPLVLGVLLAAVGLAVMARSLIVEGDGLPRVRLRPLLSLLAAMVLFGIMLRPLGLMVSAVVLVLAGSLSSPEFRLREALLLAAGLSVGAVLLFVTLLGLPLPVWPSF
ncbi:tripartite tricarboxylate transporter TctB family protein [Xanthobacter pseudotagetidis]|uniref:tripartite tricarboxylate transporter TctB family protein n=1 Tax=Xanthobacter pseudotagetidis TaxID=3119911 RepID=UPI00372647D3